MQTVNKESLIQFALRMDDEIPIEFILQFVKNKARNKNQEILKLMGIQPLLLTEEVL
jgi:hypothetical protein